MLKIGSEIYIFFSFQIRNQAMDDTKPGTSADKSSTSPMFPRQHLAPYKEVAAVRAHIRRRQYLSSTDEEREHKSLAGDVTFSKHLPYFTTMATSSMEKYMNGFLNHEPDDIIVISLTEAEEAERNNISKVTKDEIRKRIYSLFDNMDAPELLEEHFRKTISKKTHSAYVEFYYEVLAKSEIQHDDCDSD